ADVRDRPLDRADHVRDADLLGRPREPVAALDAALRADEPRVPQLGEDVLEELERDFLRLRDPLALHWPAGLGGRQLDGGANCVPARPTISSRAASQDPALRYGRSLVIASRVSATAKTRAESGTSSPPRPSG